jgi:hypothetical protein
MKCLSKGRARQHFDQVLHALDTATEVEHVGGVVTTGEVALYSRATPLAQRAVDDAPVIVFIVFMSSSSRRCGEGNRNGWCCCSSICHPFPDGIEGTPITGTASTQQAGVRHCRGAQQGKAGNHEFEPSSKKRVPL